MLHVFFLRSFSRPTFCTHRFASSCGGSLVSSTNAFRRRKDQAIRLRGVCRKVGRRFLNPIAETYCTLYFKSTALPFGRLAQRGGASIAIFQQKNMRAFRKGRTNKLRRKCEKECSAGAEG